MKVSRQPVKALRDMTTEQPVAKSTGQVLNNRPQAAAQRKLQQAADKNGHAQGFGAVLPAAARVAVVQRTEWTYKKDKWVAGKTKRTDTDGWPAPADFPGLTPKEGDVYDQSKGTLNFKPLGLGHVLTSQNQESFGAVYKERRNTAYGVFLPDVIRDGKPVISCPQGPHVIAHITKRAMLESALSFKNNFNLYTVKERTAILPSVGQNVALARFYLDKNKVKGGYIKSRLKIFRSLYKEYIDTKNNRKLSTQARNEATAKAMEMNVVAIYNLGQQATQAQLNGKGEERPKSLKDLEKIITLSAEILNRASYQSLTLDTVDGARNIKNSHLQHYLYAVGRVAVAQQPANFSDIDSDKEDFSDLDEEEKKRKEKYSKKAIAPSEFGFAKSTQANYQDSPAFSATIGKGKNQVLTSSVRTRGQKRKVDAALVRENEDVSEEKRSSKKQKTSNNQKGTMTTSEERKKRSAASSSTNRKKKKRKLK